MKSKTIERTATCVHPTCSEVRYGMGRYCQTHARQVAIYGKVIDALLCRRNDCTERLHKMGLCAIHYEEMKVDLLHQAPAKPTCTSAVVRTPRADCAVEGCTTERMALREWCNKHWTQVKRHGKITEGLPCSTPTCRRAYYSEGLCRSCFKKREYALLHKAEPVPILTDQDYFQALRDALHPPVPHEHL